MLTRIYELASQLGMSRGELLQISREVAPTDQELRTIDLLTKAERHQLLFCLESVAYREVFAV